jgi:hypothetical protein
LGKWERWDSNPESADYESEAFTIKLRSPIRLFYKFVTVRSMLINKMANLCRIRHFVCLFCERVTRFELVLRPWKGRVLPLHQTRMMPIIKPKTVNF